MRALDLDFDRGPIPVVFVLEWMARPAAAAD
jgi:hypothetical protein